MRAWDKLRGSKTGGHSNTRLRWRDPATTTAAGTAIPLLLLPLPLLLFTAVRCAAVSTTAGSKLLYRHRYYLTDIKCCCNENSGATMVECKKSVPEQSRAIQWSRLQPFNFPSAALPFNIPSRKELHRDKTRASQPAAPPTATTPTFLHSPLPCPCMYEYSTLITTAWTSTYIDYTCTTTTT